MNPRQALTIALFSVLVFASAPTCIRKVELDTIALGICRLGLASFGMTVLLALRWSTTSVLLKSWTRRTSKALVIIGLTFGVHWLLFFLSIKTANAAIGAIGFSTYGIHLILLGWLLGRGRVGRLDLMGLLLACVGTWLLIPEYSFQNDHTVGLMIGILSGFASAMLPLLHQHYADIDGNLRAWGQFTFALLVFFCCLPWAEWNMKSEDVPLILYLGLGIAFVGHGLWVHATTALSTTTTSILSYLYLPMSLVMGFFLLSEKLAGRALLGTALVLAANALVIYSQNRLGTLKTIEPEG